jgi:uncharacterized membrane protein YkvI
LQDEPFIEALGDLPDRPRHGRQTADADFPRSRIMPFIIIMLLAVLVIQFGFWDTFAGILGGIGIVLLTIVTAIAALVLTTMLAMRRRLRRRLN